jgi:hypothetical protein
MLDACMIDVGILLDTGKILCVLAAIYLAGQ